MCSDRVDLNVLQWILDPGKSRRAPEARATITACRSTQGFPTFTQFKMIETFSNFILWWKVIFIGGVYWEIFNRFLRYLTSNDQI